ncbi:ABC transporter substrate-binding protein [Roseomonas sp. SSH11]|uniref:ABC transporter substrate-binding protein n=1 Tax=Pararoseomonas baculiformis TaxID=2820812 RepID=A0ABS4AA47_9PROT|nr:ABC transporter substrate-binding protein [Pararoseomonas baculiformis]MBP0443853.1 ABC transporter substrate-binding protein [Pararoseomonas baculiformis]
MLHRRDAFKGLVAAAAATGLSSPALAQGSAARVLRVVPQANLTSLDPVWTTAVVTRNHAYLVYDQICAVDSTNTPRPQMAEGWEIGNDGREWTFTLRTGLKFHDNEPVRAQDCVASLKRWMVRDVFGQALAAQTDELSVLDDRRFRFRLKKPFPFLALAIGKSQNPCFIMPERLAATDPFTQVRDATGSGPFRFVPGEWNPGQTAVWEKFAGYQPRQEEPDGLAGGRMPRLDRIVWTVISDPATAASAMVNGEQDYWEYPLHDLLPLLRRSRDLVVEQRLLEGTYGVMRFNQLHPPFNNLAVRRAVAMAVDQRDYLRAVAGDDPKGWGTCEGVFTCGTSLASDQGSDILRTRNIDRAKAALRESGYAGERVVLIAPSDYPQINALSLVTADLMTRIGLNVEVVSADWGTVVQRRASREPVEKGGWSVVHTTSSGSDLGVPTIHLFLRANGPNAWFGWPQDDQIEALRAQWLDAPSEAESKRIGAALNQRAMEVLPYIPLGFYWQPSAWRRNLTGVFRAPATVFWNISKT